MKKILFIRGPVMLPLLTTVLILFCASLSTPPAFGAGQSDISDQTFLLGEFSITGDQVEEHIETKKEGEAQLPALSTSLRWKGDEGIELDIPKEILKNLTQPDLSQIIKGKDESNEINFD